MFYPVCMIIDCGRHVLWNILGIVEHECIVLFCKITYNKYIKYKNTIF